MAVYDILFHIGTGHPHFLDGGIIIIKPHNSVWNETELALGTKTVMNFTDNELDDIIPDILDFKVNDNVNPSSHVRGR